jgi:hypothetical protein
VTTVSRCLCPDELIEAFPDWLAAIGAFTRHPATGLLPAGCSGTCRARGLLGLRLGPRWSLRPSPPIPSEVALEPPRSHLLEPLLRDAATVRCLVGLYPDSTTDVFFVPPLRCFPLFASLLPDSAVVLPAVDIFAAMVTDGMAVRDALYAAPALA